MEKLTWVLFYISQTFVTILFGWLWIVFLQALFPKWRDALHQGRVTFGLLVGIMIFFLIVLALFEALRIFLRKRHGLVDSAKNQE